MAEGPSLNDKLSQYGLKETDLSIKCPRKVRNEIAVKFDDWKMIGYSLGFPKEKLTSIVRENETEDLCKVALLDSWSKREGEGASYLKLADALYRRQRQDLVELLCKLLIASRGATGKCRQTASEGAVAVISTTTAGLKKTFKCPCRECSLMVYLKNGCPKSGIPYLGMPVNLSVGDKRNLKYALNKDTRKVCESFRDLSNSACNSLIEQNIKLDRLIRVATNHDKSLQLSSVQSVDQAFTVFAKSMSFFNHKLLANIIEELGDDSDKQRLVKYSEEFNLYCKRKIFEVDPGTWAGSERFPDAPEGRKLFVAVTNFMVETLGDTELILETLADILEIPPAALHLHQIDEGSIILVFSIPSCIADKMFPLSQQKMSRLEDEGIMIFVPSSSLQKQRNERDLERDRLSKQPELQHQKLNSHTPHSPTGLPSRLLDGGKVLRDSILGLATGSGDLIPVFSSTHSPTTTRSPHFRTPPKEASGGTIDPGCKGFLDTFAAELMASAERVQMENGLKRKNADLERHLREVTEEKKYLKHNFQKLKEAFAKMQVCKQDLSKGNQKDTLQVQLHMITEKCNKTDEVEHENVSLEAEINQLMSDKKQLFEEKQNLQAAVEDVLKTKENYRSTIKQLREQNRVLEEQMLGVRERKPVAPKSDKEKDTTSFAVAPTVPIPVMSHTQPSSYSPLPQLSSFSHPSAVSVLKSEISRSPPSSYYSLLHQADFSSSISMAEQNDLHEMSMEELKCECQYLRDENRQLQLRLHGINEQAKLLHELVQALEEKNKRLEIAVVKLKNDDRMLKSQKGGDVLTAKPDPSPLRQILERLTIIP